MSANANDADRVWEFIDRIKVAMVVTHNGTGEELRARPMAAHAAREENAIYFLTDAESGKVEEVSADTHVCLTFADTKSQDYVSVTGWARVSNDRALIRKYWSVADKAFWSDAEDPRIRLLRVVPHEAEYWQGSAALLSYAKMFVARLISERPKLHGNEKVSLSERGDR